MNSILDELFRGDWQTPFGHGSKAAARILKEADPIYNKFYDSLTEAQQEAFGEFEIEKGLADGEEEKKAFKMGVRLGFLFALESCGMDTSAL